MKELVVTIDDLKEIEEAQSPLKDELSTEIHGELKKVLDFVKQRKFTTYALLINKFGMNRRSARNWLEVLQEKGLVDKQYALIKCADSVHRKTALYYTVDKKNGKGRRDK